MADRPSGRRLPLLLAAGAVALVLVTVVRGPLVLLAGATVLVVVGLVGIVPLLRSDGVDWGWVPDRAQEVPPEPGIADLHRLLVADDRDTAAPERLRSLVRAIAQDRAGSLDRLPDGPVSRYLAAPPTRVRLDEVERLVADLEALSAAPGSPGPLSPTTTPAPPPTSQEHP